MKVMIISIFTFSNDSKKANTFKSI